MKRPLALTALIATAFTLSIAACGREPPAQSGGGAMSQAEQETTKEQREAVTSPVTPRQDETEQAQASQESAEGGAEAEEKSDATLERLAALPESQALPNGRWKAGTHYIRLAAPQPTTAGPDEVEVLEILWYGCNHCYALEPFMQSWDKSNADYIKFVRVPVMWGPAHRAHARLFYTLEALGRQDLHPKVFDTIHQGRNLLLGNDEESTLRVQLEFARANGIDPEAFRKAWNSFGVNSNLQRAEQLTQRYRVEGVPTLIVNGKYKTDVGQAGGHQELLALLNDLAASEHRR